MQFKKKKKKKENLKKKRKYQGKKAMHAAQEKNTLSKTVKYTD